MHPAPRIQQDNMQSSAVQCRCSTVGVTGTSNQSGTACMLLAPADACQSSCNISEICTCMQFDHASQRSTVSPEIHQCRTCAVLPFPVVPRWQMLASTACSTHSSAQLHMACCTTTTSAMQPSCIGPCQHEAVPGRQAESLHKQLLQHVQQFESPCARFGRSV